MTAGTSVEERDAEWDGFLATCPRGHHEQTSLWGRVKAAYGWRPLRIVVRSGGRIVGGVQILERRVGGFGRIGYVMRGPCAASDDPELVLFTLRRLSAVAMQERLAYVVVVPPYNGELFEPGLAELGFRRKPNGLPPGGVMTATLILDLSEDLETLTRAFRRSMRNNLRRADRAGVKVREGTRHDIETFRRLMWALCERRGTSPTPPQKDFFENLWSVFHPDGLVRLFVAELQGRTVSAVIAFTFGDTVRIWKVGWAGDHAESHPVKMLYWEAIRWSKRAGYRFFDFVQLDESLARALQQGRALDWTLLGRPGTDGVDVRTASFLKLGFGGTPVVLPQPYYRFYLPVPDVLMRYGGSKLIESSAFAALASRFWGRMSAGES